MYLTLDLNSHTELKFQVNYQIDDVVFLFSHNLLYDFVACYHSIVAPQLTQGVVGWCGGPG